MADYNSILKRFSKVKGGCAHIQCDECPLNPIECDYDKFDLNGVLRFLDDWDAAHPVKTYAQDFFEKFPNAPKSSVGTPKACPYNCGYCADSGCVFDSNRSSDCIACWNRPMPDAQQDC